VNLLQTFNCYEELSCVYWLSTNNNQTSASWDLRSRYTGIQLSIPNHNWQGTSTSDSVGDAFGYIWVPNENITGIYWYRCQIITGIYWYRYQVITGKVPVYQTLLVMLLVRDKSHFLMYPGKGDKYSKTCGVFTWVISHSFFIYNIYNNYIINNKSDEAEILKI
jgi:hypothetical protein